MKLLVYSHYFSPSIGGVETIVQSLARGLAGVRDGLGRLEFDVTVVTQTPCGNDEKESFPFRVVRRPKHSQLWEVIRCSDVVHLAGPALEPLILSLIARKPLVIEHHGFQTICPNGQLLIEPTSTPCPGHFMAKRYGECFRCNAAHGWVAARKLWLLTFARRLLSTLAKANITPTHWLDSQLQLPRSITIAHGIQVTSSRKYSRPLKSMPVMAFQGRLVTTKGVRVLLEAARILKKQGQSFKLLVIGDGPERISLEELAKGSDLEREVDFRGRLDDSELDAALGLATILVVPSLGGEVFGLVVAENMLRSLTVVASDLGAFVEVLDAAGVIFRTGDAGALASELSRLFNDPEQVSRLGDRAHARVVNLYNWSHMIKQHTLVYRRLSKSQSA